MSNRKEYTLPAKKLSHQCTSSPYCATCRRRKYREKHKTMYSRKANEYLRQSVYSGYRLKSHCEVCGSTDKRVRHHRCWEWCTEANTRSNGYSECKNIKHLMTVCLKCHTSIHIKPKLVSLHILKREIKIWERHLAEI